MRTVNIEVEKIDENQIKVKAISRLSGEEQNMILPMTMEQFETAMQAWELRKVLIQEAFPTLTDQQREFLMTGSTQEEWDKAFPKEEEE